MNADGVYHSNPDARWHRRSARFRNPKTATGDPDHLAAATKTLPSAVRRAWMDRLHSNSLRTRLAGISAIYAP
jgi:hypothetical protein